MVILGCYISLVPATIHLFEFLVNLDNLEKLRQMYGIKLNMHGAKIIMQEGEKKNLISIKELPPP